MQNNNSVYLSMIIPAFNEEFRLPSTLDSIFEYLDKQDYTYEIIVVDDGSIDKTASLVEQNPNYPEKIKLIKHSTNHGKGYAVRKGVESAIGNFIIFNDADGATPVEEIEKLQQAINNGADIAIASRALRESTVEDLWYRKIMGIMFNKLIKVIILRGIQDTQCGFKLFKADCAKKIFSKLILVGFSFDVEVLFLAKKMGYKVTEVPVCWKAIPGTKINPFLDSPVMFLGVVKIKLMDLLGKYKI
ncbi:MAG: dolichyl-phosphate beta-glucosyltransferase [Cyanobacteriota bacterium]